jgi:hypothetical protein
LLTEAVGYLIACSELLYNTNVSDSSLLLRTSAYVSGSIDRKSVV